jgi:hypothetical protein
MLELVGEDMDVHTGGVRCYLPGVGSPGDHPQRHFALFYRALEGRAPDRAALRIAPVLQRQALDTSPPRVWEELRSHVDGADPDERTITVQRLIGRGESTQIEFKASMRWDIAQQRVNKELTKAVAKTMCAFLNSHGGTLLIGVADDGTPVGIEHDIRSLDPPNVDRVHLTIRAALGEHLGEDVSPLIDVTFSEIAGHTVAVLSCSAHDLPVFYDEGGSVKFFIRAGNASPPLDVREALDYVRRHWPAQLWES